VSLKIQKSNFFIGDFERQFAWYALKAHWNVARQYLLAVDETLEYLAMNPRIGRVRRFSHPRLRGIRSYRVKQPFIRHLVFYRFSGGTLFAERVLYGARDLARRLVEQGEEGVD